MKKTVRVEFEVEIEYDERFFSKKFMKAFRGYMYPFKTVNEHLEHLAQLQVRYLADGFVEGYGVLNEKDIHISSELSHIEVL
jgi:hypothetical protein